MADVSGKFFSATKVRTGVSPSSPGTIVGETLPPVNPPGSSLADYVTYTGATQNVDLGEFGVEAGFVTLDTTPTNTPTAQGTIFWDADDNTVDVVLNGYIMKIGEDLFYPVKNQTGSNIPKGRAVRFAGTLGASGRLLVAPFIADGSVPSTFFMGVTAEAIADGEDGKVLYFGRIRGMNTLGFEEGDVLYASTTTAGEFQTAVPVAPNNIVQVAAVINKSITQGVIFVRPSFGSNINQDEGVKIVSPTTGQLLQLQSNGLWENKTKAQVLGGTSSQFVKGDGTLDSNTYQVTSEKGQPNGYASLDSNGKVPLAQINDALIGNVNFQGLWNAATNTPTLANPPASGTKGYYYIVSTAGTFAGISFEVGDWIISSGSAWQKIDNTDAVSSVFGRTGNVVASNGDYTTAQVTESGNLYYTDGRARGALSFVAGSGAYNSSTGVITIPTNNNQITNGAGYITSAALSAYLPLIGGTMTGAILMGTGVAAAGNTQPTALSYGLLQGFGTFTLAADTDGSTTEFAVITSGYGIANATPANGLAVGFNTLTWKNNAVWHAGNITPVTSVTASSPLFSSGGTTPNITIQQANGSQSGFLSSTDWTTFNNKASTAALAAYLPLAGGTLTGALGGTSASFSESIKVRGGSNLGGYYFDYQSDASSRSFRISSEHLAFADFVIQRSTTRTGTTYENLLYFDVNRAATFSSSVTANLLTSTNQVIANNTITTPTNDITLSNGTVYALNGNSTTNNYGIGVSGIRNGNYDIWFQTGSTNGGGYRFYKGTSELMTIATSGNVGIGTASPSEILHLNKTSGTGTFIRFQDTAGGGVYIGGRDERMELYAGGAERMRITSGGNVLIGTTTDAGFKLDVGTSGTGTNLRARRIFANGTGTDSGFSLNGTLIYQDSSGNFNITNPGSFPNTAFLINTSGAATFSSLSGSGNRIVVANSGGTLISAVIGSGLAFDGTTLTATGGSSGSISGSGTSGTIALFTGGTSIGNSVITESGTSVQISRRTDISVGGQSIIFLPNLSSLTNRIETTGSGLLPLELVTSGASISLAAGGVTPQFTVTSGNNVLIGTTTVGASRLRIVGLPTSSTGLSAGDVWASAGFLRIV
jgi:hypothetical protein